MSTSITPSRKRTKFARSINEPSKLVASPSQRSRVGNIETWFSSNEEKISVFPQEMSRKRINMLKVLKSSWLKEENLKDAKKLYNMKSYKLF